MKVRMLVTMSGTRNGKEWPPRGNTIDLPDDEATQLCRANMAIPSPEIDVETTTRSDVAVETRTAPSPAVTEKPLTTKTGPGPGRKATR